MYIYKYALENEQLGFNSIPAMSRRKNRVLFDCYSCK